MTNPGRFQPPSNQIIVYGQPVATALPKVMRDLWAVNSVLVTNTALSGAGGLADQVAAVLDGCVSDRINGLHAGAPRADVVRVTTALRSKGVDTLIAVGGSSVAEVAKAARICLTNNVRDAADMDRLHLSTTVASPRPYLVSIPTTLAGAEYTQFVGVYDEKNRRKDAFYHPDLAPDVVILDPQMTLQTPRTLWLGTGMRALDHAIETWCAPTATPYSDATAQYAAGGLLKHLPSSADNPDDPGPRLECQVAAWMAIQGARIGVPHGASHVIGNALGAVAGLAPHLTSSILLPHVLRFTAPVTGGRQTALAGILGQPDQTLADIVARLTQDLGLPTRLSEVNLTPGQLPQIAEAAFANPALGSAPRPFTDQNEILTLLQAAY